MLQVPLRLADELDDELVNALFSSGKWKEHKDAQRVTMRLCNVSTGRVLELINPRRACAVRFMRSEGYSSCFVILSVCLSVTTFSAATSNKTANKRYEWVQCHTGFIFKIAFFVKMLRSKVIIRACIMDSKLPYVFI